MMINEPATSPQANAIFTEDDYVLIIRNLHPDEEITVYYGNTPTLIAIRNSQGYTTPYMGDPKIFSSAYQPAPPAIRAYLTTKWHAHCPLIRDPPEWTPAPAISPYRPTHGINNPHNQCYLNAAIHSLYPLHALSLESTITHPNSHLFTPLKTTLQQIHQKQPPDRRSQDLTTTQLLHELNIHYDTTFNIHVQNSPTDIQLLLLQTFQTLKPHANIPSVTHTREIICGACGLCSGTSTTETHILLPCPSSTSPSIPLEECLLRHSTPSPRMYTCPYCSNTHNNTGNDTFTPTGHLLLIILQRANSPRSTQSVLPPLRDFSPSSAPSTQGSYTLKSITRHHAGHHI